MEPLIEGVNWWFVRNGEPVLGMWISYCCECDLAPLDQQGLGEAIEMEKLGRDPIVFGSQAVGIAWHQRASDWEGEDGI